MLEAFAINQHPGQPVDFEAVLTFEERQKSRHKCQTQCGQHLGWFIERGTILNDGDVLECQSGERVRVVAAPESVSQVESDDTLLLTRAAYHLGNRHVPLQIGEGFLRYQHDHVLDGMVQGLGLSVLYQQLPFYPKNGAYHGKSHGHSHSHSHEPGHNHGHHHG